MLLRKGGVISAPFPCLVSTSTPRRSSICPSLRNPDRGPKAQQALYFETLLKENRPNLLDSSLLITTTTAATHE
jgi:hypothetical protein